MRARVILVGLLGLFAISCKSNKTKNTEESKFFTDSIYSKNLSEYRKHNIYLPKGFDSKKEYSILFATDGNEIKENAFYKKTLDSLINNQIIKPILLIASHSNNKIADSTSITLGNVDKVYLQYRNFEYINDYASKSKNPLLVNRFKNHMLYFNNELISTIEKKYNQKLNKNSRYFYGVSNGAGFGLSLLNNYPNTIGTYICFSTAGGDTQTNNWKKNIEYPNLYLQYGSDEFFGLKEDAEFLKSKYKELNLFTEIKEFNGGHDYKIWNEEFTKTIAKLFKYE
jgi:enterochelin esterase-like enzyme